MTKSASAKRIPVLDKKQQLNWAPTGLTYDFRNMLLQANPRKYPLVLHHPGVGVCLTGGRVSGQQKASLTWKQMKGQWDGDAVALQDLTGAVIVENFYLDNVMDGIAPRGTVTANWTVRNIYARHIRDDFIENDHCLAGVVEDVLVDGAFMFLSSRPGSRGRGLCPSKGTVTIRDSVVRLECQAYGDSDSGQPSRSCGPGTGVGQLFKWTSSAGIVVVRDTVFLVPSISVNGPSSMGFPLGSYNNVTIVWLGSGPYPHKLPAGVTVTTNPAAFYSARQKWLTRHGCDADAHGCSFLVR